MTKDEALELALEALENAWLDASMGKGDVYRHNQAITAIKEALAQPEQKPVARLLIKDGYISVAAKMQKDGEYQLYTSPPQRQPLTEEKQIAEDLRFHGLQLVKTVTGYAVLKLGQVAAHNIKEIK